MQPCERLRQVEHTRDQIAIKKASLEDIELVRPFFIELTNHFMELDPEASHHYVSPSEDERWKKFVDYASGIISNDSGRLLLAFADKQPIGFLVGHIKERDLTPNIGYFKYLFVDPVHRGKYIGTHLMCRLYDWFRDRGVQGFDAYINERNEAALKFAQKFGFEVHSHYLFSISE